MQKQLEQARRRLQFTGASLYYFAGRHLGSTDHFIDADYLREGFRDRLTVIQSVVDQNKAITQILLNSQGSPPYWPITVDAYNAEMQRWIDDFDRFVDSLPSFNFNSSIASSAQSSSSPKSISDSALASFIDRYRRYLDLLQFFTSKVTDLLIDRPARIKALADKLVNRWTRLQFPQDCKRARILHCVTGDVSGIGSTSRWVQYCFWIAFVTKRLLYYDTTGWFYTAEPYDTMFLPITNCTDISQTKVHISESNGAEQVIYLKWWDKYETNYRIRTMPLELERELQLVDLDPFGWVGGLIARFTIKLQPNVRQQVDNQLRLMKFSHPIVGMHVRRTDKTSEAPYQPIEVYFKAADLYFDLLDARTSTKPVKRRVFLATDEPNVINEAHNKYPHYEIIADGQRANSAANGRKAGGSLLNVLIDMHALLDTDHLICTMSSNFCILLHQMRLTDVNKEHATTFVDRGENEFLRQRPRFFNVLYPQTSDTKHDLLETKVNDTLSYDRFGPEGMIRGENLRTKKVGLYHYYKVSEIFDKLDTNNSLFLDSFP